MTKPKSKPWYIWASRNPEDSYGSTIIQDRALEGADSKELAELAANQVKGTLYAGDVAMLATGLYGLGKGIKAFGLIPTVKRIAAPMLGGIAAGGAAGTAGHILGERMDSKHPYGPKAGIAADFLSRAFGYMGGGIGAKTGNYLASKFIKQTPTVSRWRYISENDDLPALLSDPKTAWNYGSPDPNVVRPQWPSRVLMKHPDGSSEVLESFGVGWPYTSQPNIVNNIPKIVKLNNPIRKIDRALENYYVRRHSSLTNPNIQPPDGSSASTQPINRNWSELSLDELTTSRGRAQQDLIEIDDIIPKRIADPQTSGEQIYNFTRNNLGLAMRVAPQSVLNFTDPRIVWLSGKGFVYRPSATRFSVLEQINNTINNAPRGSIFNNSYSENSLPLVLRTALNNYGTGSGQMRIISPTGGSAVTNGYGRGVTFRDLFSETYLTDPTTPTAVKDWYSSFVNGRATNMPQDVHDILSRRATDMYHRYLSRAIKTNQERWDKLRTLDPNLPEFTFRESMRLKHPLEGIITHGNAPLYFTYPEFVVQKYRKGGKQLKNN